MSALAPRSGAPVGPFPPYFDVTSPLFGAKGDSSPATDDSPAIQAAIDAAVDVSGGNATIGVYIPDAPRRANGSQGFYNLKSALTVHKNTRLFGAGMWTTILNFPNDTSGITGGTNVNRVQLEKLGMIGNAPLSTSANVTAGTYLLENARWLIRDVYVQDFVDGLVFDSGTIGNALHDVDNFWIYNTGYPNATNRYPRYGIRMTGQGNTRVQGVRIGGGSTISGNTLNSPDMIVRGDGTTVSFNIKPTGPLWAESGIKVYRIGAFNIITKQISGIDYNIYDFTTGANVLIPPGSFGSKSQNINVIFAAPPAAGSSYRIMYSDPTMQIGLYLDRANGNSIELTQIQGAQTLYVDVLGQNSIHVAEIEIADVAYAPAGAQYSEFTFGHAETSVDQLYSTSPPGSPGNIYQVSDRGAGWGWTETQGTGAGIGDQTFTSATPTVIETDAGNAGTLRFNELGRCTREVQVEGTLAFTNSAGGAAEAELTVEVSFDGTVTWTTIGQFRVSGYCDTSSTFYLPFSQTYQDRSNQALPAAGSPQAVFYRVLIALVAGTGVAVVTDDSETYRLRARDVNRSGD